MKKRILSLTFGLTLLALYTLLFPGVRGPLAQGGQTSRIITSASDPSTCDADAEIYGNTTANTLKFCNATNTFITIGGTVLNRRNCDLAVGDESSSAITNAQLGPQSRICYVPAGATIVELDVAADGGTPNVIVGKNHAGTISNIVSSALATAASGGIACSNTGGTTGIDGATTCSATLQNTSLSAGDYLELVSGTAGGTAKLMTIHVIYTVN